ncbi:DUF805 domain-containing protein [Photobacterium sp. CCB-ST2H9]
MILATPDIGRSGRCMLLNRLSILSFLILLYFFVQDGQSGTNEYGPNPK